MVLAFLLTITDDLTRVLILSNAWSTPLMQFPILYPTYHSTYSCCMTPHDVCVWRCVIKWLGQAVPLKQDARNMHCIYVCINRTDPRWQHSIEADHRIKFHEAQIWAKTSGYMGRLIKEAMYIKLHPESTARKGSSSAKHGNPAHDY
jgi:hypothetical protein